MSQTLPVNDYTLVEETSQFNEDYNYMTFQGVSQEGKKFCVLHE